MVSVFAAKPLGGPTSRYPWEARAGPADRGTGNMAVKRPDKVVLVPAALGAVGLGALTAEIPIVSGGLFGFGILMVLPWVALYFLLNGFAMIQSAAYGPLAGVLIGGYSFSPAHLILIPFAIRAYLMTREDLRTRWTTTEWLIASF